MLSPPSTTHHRVAPGSAPPVLLIHAPNVAGLSLRCSPLPLPRAARFRQEGVRRRREPERGQRPKRRAQPAGQPVRVADQVRGFGSRPFRAHRPGDGCLARSKRCLFLRWHQQRRTPTATAQVAVAGLGRRLGPRRLTARSASPSLRPAPLRPWWPLAEAQAHPSLPDPATSDVAGHDSASS
ncbi:4'-phosphopantetheinyl transferase superfamily [Zea mays]|uniref:4'-phosphopantetheinyl transferase superfamily n=1 Tax=Zea mays TaxID=4577 RepID=A0A1D6JKT0_MAIZE|nr:4'-phosphopantetheinyl transferase superfamily [Zea mays]